jgi:hypothetical protein
LKKYFLVFIDVCKEGIDGFLMQEVQVIIYESRKLNEHKKKYVTNDLELVAIVHALKMWRHYLLERKFILMIDYSGLKYFFHQLRLNVRQARWMALINEFDFEMKHIKGKDNKVTDALSWGVQIIQLTTTSVREFDVQQRIKTLS